MIPSDLIRKRVLEIFPKAVDIRRKIHANPELSGKELKTARLIYETCTALGLDTRYCVGKTGVHARLSNGRGGPTVVLRADTDALPIQEETGLPFQSVNSGVMHACGHDLHTAMLLCAAMVLKELRSQWSGTVVFLFQPSEEVEPGGAIQMIREKVLPRGAAALFGMHVSTDYPSGIIGLRAGPDYAGVMTFDVKVKGQGAHGAAPDQAVDPIVCAASMLLELQTIISRERPPFEPAVLTVGSIHAGMRRNIIPDEAVFLGTIRTHSVELQEFLRRRVSEVLAAIAHSYRAAVEVSFEKSYPASYNDPQITARATKMLSNMLGDENVKLRPNPTMYAEDFAYLLQKIPGVYAHLGIRPPKKKSVAGIHSARFAPDEAAMKTGIAAHVAFALEFLGAK